TLTDREYQLMRDMAIRVIRKVGVETGGSNIQFGVNPENGEIRIIEMNPRVSRSSALASKATGFPIAKIAAKLAVGYTLDDISNDELQRKLARPNSQRFSYISYALQHGWPLSEIYRLSRIDPWFLDQLQQVMEIQHKVEGAKLEEISLDELRAFKEVALSDRRLAYLTGRSEDEVRAYRKQLGLVPVYKRVDTCGA